MTAGRLVRRIDPQALPSVRAELDAPTRGRRKRALEMALALDAVVELHEPIAALLADEDQFLRIEAIRTLATVDTERTRQVLQEALLDPRPLVQEAAEAAIYLLGRTENSASAATRDTVCLSDTATTVAEEAGNASLHRGSSQSVSDFLELPT